MLSGINSSICDEVNRQSNAIAKRREQLRRWDESETNRESSELKLCQRVQFEEAYMFLAACAAQDQDDIDQLLEHGVDINTSNIDGLTALHQSCIDNNLNMVEYLLNKNADINCQDNEGWTPLHAAASCSNLSIVKYLLSHGAIVDACNNEGQLPIDISEDDQIIEILEEDMRFKGIDDQQSRNYEHQLMIKHAQDCFNNSKNPLKSFVDSVVHIRTGATALHVAAAKGYFDVIEILIRSGANINARDNDGWTPLHAAAHWDQHDIIKYLIEKHADLHLKNDAGQTPFEVCDEQTLQLLNQLKEKYSPIKIKSTSTTMCNDSPDHLKEKLNVDEKELINVDQNEKKEIDLSKNNQRIFTNPLQSLTTSLFHFNPNLNSFLRDKSKLTETKINTRWGSNDRPIDENLPYVRRCSDVSVTHCDPLTSINETNSKINVRIVSSSTELNDQSKKRLNRDEEAEAQRKHRSAQARRERRSTQSVSMEQIKAAQEQMRNDLSNNPIGAPSTPSTQQEQTNEQIPPIIANDSLNLHEQQKRSFSRRNYQKVNLFSNDQQQSSLTSNQLNINQLYEHMNIQIQQLNQQIIQLQKDLLQRDQIIDQLKTSQLIESSFDKREKRSYERKLAELEEDLKKIDSIKSDNTRLKEENAALIRVISKLSK